jgi:hypothetical protein
MNRATVIVIALAVSLVAAGCMSDRFVRYDRGRPMKADTLAMMSKQDVVSLSKAGVGDSLIIRMLDASGSYIPLRTRDVIELKNAGVSEQVINAMMNPPEDSDNGGESVGSGYANYPPYYWYSPYWYSAYYPFWDPWYYSSFYLGFGPRYYRPGYVHSYIARHYSISRPGYRSGGGYGGGGYSGSGWGGARSSGGRSGGGHRR